MATLENKTFVIAPDTVARNPLQSRIYGRINFNPDTVPAQPPSVLDGIREALEIMVRDNAPIGEQFIRYMHTQVTSALKDNERALPEIESGQTSTDIAKMIIRVLA